MPKWRNWLTRQVQGLGPVSTNGWGYVILCGWRSPKLSTNALRPSLPVQRGNVSLSNLQVLNAILYVAEHGCKWRGLPTRVGNWHTIYTRMNRWSRNGVLDRP